MALVQDASGGQTISGSTFTVTLPSATSAGNVLIVCAAENGNYGTPTGWTKAVSNDIYQDLHVYYKATTAGETSWAFPGSTFGGAAWYVREESGLSTTHDTAVANGTSSKVTSLATGSTGTLAQASELAILCSNIANSTDAATGATDGFTSSTNGSYPSTGSSGSLHVWEQYTTATTALNSTVSSSVSKQMAVALVTFKVSATAYSGTASDTITATISAAGGGTGSASLAGTATISASGTVATSSTASTSV
ncbi:MAG: hypothetical protein KGL35_12100, partial [Bradyrhizobium sp.]|nr:hypothetical protein [Bradyrhizobium sp.]